MELARGIALDRTDRKLQAKLGGAGAVPVTVNFCDIPSQEKKDNSAYKPAPKLTETSGTTYVDICEAPKSQGTVRVVNYINIHNSTGGAIQATIQILDNATGYIQWVIDLAATESATWTPESSWKIVT